MPARYLTALPVYNELESVTSVLDEVLRFSPEVLVVDDGSTDGTSRLVIDRGDVQVVSHQQNRGYGAALISAFEYAIVHRYDLLVTIDCDGQHEPQRIPAFVSACHDDIGSGGSGSGPDIVSGSRYLQTLDSDSKPPEERMQINRQITHELNQRLGLEITDAFCGFKAYRVSALSRLRCREPGYGMPLELWVQAVFAGLKIVEIPVPMIYLDEARSFGGALDDGRTRLEYYHEVLERSLAALGPAARSWPLPTLCPEGAGQC